MEQMPIKEIMLATDYREISTRNGNVLVVDAIATRESENKRIEYEILMPLFFDSVQYCGKIPCLITYHGKLKVEDENLSSSHDHDHDMRFVSLKEAKELNNGIITPIEVITISDDEEDYACIVCRKKNCHGLCSRCNHHQPDNGSQCRCGL